MDSREALNVAVRHMGSTQKLCDAIGFTQNALWRAMRNGRPTAEMSNNIEAVTGGRVTRLMLRPDLFAEKAEIVEHAWRCLRRSERRARMR